MENPESVPARIDRMLDRRPPLPPAPVDARWNWTRQRLKAVYLEAFTNLKKTEIAEALGTDTATLWRWRRAPDYRRYLATLIAADGLADRAERVKARKGIAQSLGDAIAARMATPGALAGEKLSSLLRAQREMLDALQEDAESLRELGAEQEAAARAGTARPGLDLADKLAAINDPHEREIVKRHLLAMMGEYLDAPRAIEAVPQALDVDPGTQESASAESLEQSSMLDSHAGTDAPATLTPDTPKSAGNVSLDDFAE